MEFSGGGSAAAVVTAVAGPASTVPATAGTSSARCSFVIRSSPLVLVRSRYVIDLVIYSGGEYPRQLQAVGLSGGRGERIRTEHP
ncbi:hypothetical protein GCM10009754_47660 [Amycolatopsis minnesotensis]|uniref:Secreted protein n=1 Tax=Amycolatopsis minnesotensis TaxID=337894 RepID=A0ABN2RGW0_9PSEU